MKEIKITCKGCDEVFFVHKYRKETAKFCGRSCTGRIYTCDTCHKDFKRKGYLARTKKLYCSRECQTKSVIYKGHPDYTKRKGEDRTDWKGESASYTAKHQWISRMLGKPKLCIACGRESCKKYEWANVDHQYKRKIEDYIRLCTQCHRRYDYE